MDLRHKCHHLYCCGWIATKIATLLEVDQQSIWSWEAACCGWVFCQTDGLLLDGPAQELGSLTTHESIGKVSIPRKHWVAECPTQPLGNRQVAPHER